MDNEFMFSERKYLWMQGLISKFDQVSDDPGIGGLLTKLGDHSIRVNCCPLDVTFRDEGVAHAIDELYVVLA